MQQLEYPIFVTVDEAAGLLRRGRTSIFASIKNGDLKIAKFGRSTRITFSSVIAYAQRCLKDGDQSGVLAQILGGSAVHDVSLVAEHLVRQLCNTHRENTEVTGKRAKRAESPDIGSHEARSPEKNFGGEF